ncbi:small, acid-soluble spore protein, alpha/beta type [Anaerosinus sp.]|uniref:small, acid-soluble spore protein, alpha/beta type n=1 Tax=Selenobaculum sp. TaxID=3074374 RepID=UPI0015A7E170
MSRTSKPVNPAAQNSLDKMKYEIANELGIADAVRQNGWSTMTSADCGRVGGHMVRKMIEQYESSMNKSQS